MREAVETFDHYGLRSLEHWALRHLSEFLRSRGFEPVILGRSVLRVETAAIVAVALVAGAYGMLG